MSRLFFSAPQRALHWLMAACIVTMLFVGIGMISTVAPCYLGLLSFHEALGLTILALAVVRLTLRFVCTAPSLPADMPPLMRFAAIGSQYALYVCMFGMPLIGWAMVSASSHPVLVAGVRVPALAPVSATLYAWLRRAHFVLALGFFGLVLMHFAAALFHKLVRKDGVFETMARLRARVLTK